QQRGHFLLAEQTGGGFGTAASHANRRLPGQCAGCGPLSACLGLPTPRQRQGGGPASQGGAAPDLFARFDAGVCSDPSPALGGRRTVASTSSESSRYST